MPVNNRPVPSPASHRRTPTTVFVKASADGKPIERMAYTPSEAVALTFDGWRPKPTDTTPDPAQRGDTPAPGRESRTGASTKNP